MCKSKDCQHKKESPIKDWKHRCKFGPDGKRLYVGVVIAGWNDMATTHPWLAKECINDSKKVKASTHKMLRWKCRRCGYDWLGTGHNRVAGNGCPCCRNRVVVPGINDMATTHPELAKDFMGDPRSTTAVTHRVLMWKCAKCQYEWSQQGRVRVHLGNGCPCCSNQIVVPGINDMATTHPELAKECISGPTKYIAGTAKKLLWKCNACSSKWISTGYNRVNGKGCPKCGKFGHDQTKPSFVYLIHRPGQIQYGIMNIWTNRLKHHARKGWELLDKIEATGQKARSLETTIKRNLKAKGIPVGGDAFREEFDGSTEAFQEVDLTVSSIRELCDFLGIDLDAFLAA